jgi:hypothetical protein
MRRALLVVSICAFGLSTRIFAAEDRPHPDFSGKWELVKEKSDFGKMPQPVEMTLVSEKKDGYLHSVETTQTADGEKTAEGDWYPDGKHHEYSEPVAGYSVTHWDGQSLITERKSNDGTYRQTVKLTMQANGREAVESVETHTPSGDSRVRLYWRRQ